MAISANIQRLRQLSDVATNDSDKTITAAQSEGFRILSGNVNLITTATAGARQMEVHVRDAAGVIVYKVSAGTTQIASLTHDYTLLPGGVRNTTLVNSELIIPLPIDLVMLPGWDIRVFDSAAIDAAADDMLIQLVVEEIF